MTDEPLLTVDGLTVSFLTPDGPLVAVDGVDLTVEAGETVCLVGESGSGKTVLTESITRLLETPDSHVEGTVRYHGRDLLSLSEPALRSVRGHDIAHVFQNPQEAMNHCYTVGWQLIEAIRVHEAVSTAAARDRAIALLDRVGLSSPSTQIDAYPHELSGGQKQRVMIAMALAGDPDLLIADEPTTALDVTVQSQILSLFDELQDANEMGVLFVTHDLGVVAQIADRVVVVYAGKVMERGDAVDIFERPAHPYTRQLLSCLPSRGGPSGGIPGRLPDLRDPPAGCRFAPRCSHAVSACHDGGQPPAHPVNPGQRASCVHYADDTDPAALAAATTSEPTTTQTEPTDE